MSSSPRKKVEVHSPPPTLPTPASVRPPPTHEEHSGEETPTTRSRECSPESAPTQKISCVECRRLKRKCDRIHPCNQCRRYDKECTFPQPEVPRRGKKYLAEVRGRVERLERLLAKHAPHISLDHLPDGGDSPDDHPPPSMIPQLTTPFPPPSYTSTALPRVSDERGRHMGPGPATGPTPGPTPPSTDFLPSMGMPSPAHHARGLQTPVLAPSMSPSSSIGQFDHPSSSSGSIIHHSHPPPSHASHARHRFPSQHPPPGHVQAATDAYERQPKTAMGYEWNERRRAADHDGTASLSVNPEGQGYIGFAAGATVLRMVQLATGGVDIEIPKTEHLEPPAPEKWEPKHQQKELFIKAYFAHYHTQYPIVHQATFMAQFEGVNEPPPPLQWEMLLNVVLGLGAFCAGQPMHVIDYFLERASKVITVEHLETGSLVLVQAFTLLSNLAQKRDKINAGSNYLGIAVRMAIALGLHRELPAWNIKPFDREVRRRVWWVVFIFDSGASITFGRPILLPDREADVRYVHNVPDHDFTPKSLEVPPASREKTLYSALYWQSTFCAATNRIYNAVIGTPGPDPKDLLGLDRDLQDWHKSVPEWMTRTATPEMFDDTPWLYFSAHKLYWRYENLRIILARRHFLDHAFKGLPLTASSSPQPMSYEHALANICVQCSLDTIYDIHGYFRGRTLNRLDTWYGLHFLFQASFVPLMALRTDPMSPDSGRWQEAMRLTRETLHWVKGDPLADRCYSIIEQLMPPPVSDEISTPNDLHTGLFDIFQGNPMWNTINPELLPFADLGTLLSFWPANPPTQ